VSLIRASIRRPVAVSMVFIAITCLGLISLRRLPIDLLPDLSFPRIVIYTTYPDVSPLEIERVITSPIESRLTRLPGKERVESITREGLSLIVIRFAWGTRMDLAMLNVREAVDNARATLPQSATLNILRSDPTADPVMSLSVSGYKDMRGLRELAESVIKRRLEQQDGVAQAEVTGGLSREIQVKIDPALLQVFGITLNEVANALDQANASSTGGRVRRGLYSFGMRTLGEFRSIEELGEVAVRKGISNTPPPPGQTRPGVGQNVYLREIATITDGFRDRESIARYNGEDAVGLLVFKEAGSNTVLVSETVRQTIASLESEYDDPRTPGRDLRIDVATDQAEFISAALSNVKNQVLVGGLLAFLVLFLFLRDIRYPIAIALAMPISVLAAFALLDLFGVTLNLMSLGGLALGVGMLMDNSIVVTENIFRHREMGASAMEAAARGVSEVRNPVITSTLTTIAVFGPIIYIEGVAGALFGALSFAVAFSLAMSIVAALFLLPTMAAKWTEDVHPVHSTWAQRALQRSWRAITTPFAAVFRPPLDAFDRSFERFRRWYERMLDAALHHRTMIMVGALLLLVASLYVAAGLKRTVLPEVDQGSFRVALNLERGTPLEITDDYAMRIERVLLEDSSHVDAVFTRVGRQLLITGVAEEESGANTAAIDVRMHKGLSSSLAVERVRAIMSQFPPNSVSIQTGQATALGRLLGNTESDLSVRVSSDDMARAFEYANLVESRMSQLTSITNVGIGNKLGQPEVRVEVDRERAAERGVPLSAVSAAIASYMRGVNTRNQFIDFDKKVPIIVQLPDAARDSMSSIEQLTVNGVQLRELITLQEGVGASEIRHVDQKSVVTISADLRSSDLEAAEREIQRTIQQDVPPPSGIDVTVAGENEEMQRSIDALLFAMILAVLLCYMIMAAEFESFMHPFTVMLSVPLGVIGAFFALGLTGTGLNTISLIGIVVLIGVVDNDAVVKVEFINQMRAEGMSVRDAIRAAGHHRLRPILINTITTLLGVLPMVIGLGAGAELQRPLAVALFGGLITATALTLIVIPVIYELLEELRQKIRVAFGMSAEREVYTPQPAAGD
jgi:HAE1 family hydrophobic/amphiphilic exporter-1